MKGGSELPIDLVFSPSTGIRYSELGGSMDILEIPGRDLTHGTHGAISENKFCHINKLYYICPRNKTTNYVQSILEIYQPEGRS